MPSKLTKEVVNERLASRNIRLVGDYINMKTKTEFECPKGHVWLTNPHGVLNGNGCPRCSTNATLTKEIVNERLQGRGIKLVGEYVNVATKAEFKCSNDHVWLVIPNSILRGYGCPHCSGIAKSDKEAVNEVLNGSGIKLVGEYLNNRTNAEFECEQGHRWSARPDNVSRRKSCPHCTGHARLTKEEINERLSDRGFELVGNFDTVDDRAEFKCREGHHWFAAPASVMARSGCPHCSGRAELSKQVVNARIGSRGIKLVGEYVGSLWKTSFECEEGHRWGSTPDNVMRGNGCPHCAGQAPLSKEIINERLTERGIALLSDYKTVMTKGKFRCPEGHIWNATVDSVLRLSGCPTCSVTYTANDTVYIWQVVGAEHAGNPIYKVGITSERRGNTRIHEVSKRGGLEADIVIVRQVANAREIETKLKLFGDDPQLDVPDGSTEFRAYTNAQLQEAIKIVEDHAAEDEMG